MASFSTRYSPLLLLGVLILLQCQVAFSTPVPQTGCTPLGGGSIARVRRQTVTIGDLMNQYTPCIPTTVDTSSLKATVQTVSTSSDRTSTQSFGSWLSKVWGKIQTVIKVFNVLKSIDWSSVVSWIKNTLLGWTLSTSSDGMTVTATSPDKSQVQVYHLTSPAPPKQPPEEVCGPGTKKMCRRRR